MRDNGEFELLPFMSVRECPKCGSALQTFFQEEDALVGRWIPTSALQTLYHSKSEPGMSCWKWLHRSENYGPQHLCRTCRICRYEWSETVQEEANADSPSVS